jgi:SAM-dependent methyltransferase
MSNDLERAEQANQRLWDEIAPVHARSYSEVRILRDGGIALDEIELREVGDVQGKKLLHLQCHIGTDTLSWVRRGAIVTGVDFSAVSIDHAKTLQQELNLEATFIHANVYDLRDLLNETFDIVYTSKGVLCWLRDLEEWARIVAHYLKPGGRFYLMESHPICDIFDDTRSDELSIAHRYFHSEEPTVWDDSSPDYSDENYVPENPSYEWTWTVSDIINSLIQAGLQLEFFNEYDRIFDKRFPGMVKRTDGWFYLPEYGGKLPLLFTLRAKKATI